MGHPLGKEAQVDFFKDHLPCIPRKGARVIHGYSARHCHAPGMATRKRYGYRIGLTSSVPLSMPLLISGESPKYWGMTIWKWHLSGPVFIIRMFLNFTLFLPAIRALCHCRRGRVTRKNTASPRTKMAMYKTTQSTTDASIVWKNWMPTLPVETESSSNCVSRQQHRTSL